MNELDELYREVVLDHGNRPRNFREIENADHQAEGFNPLCGDRITLYLRHDGDTIAEAAIQGSGCAISTASASLLTEVLAGKTDTEARELFAKFHAMLTADPSDRSQPEGLGKLAALSGVRQFPSRVKCATLAWHTLIQALDGESSPTSTE